MVFIIISTMPTITYNFKIVSPFCAYENPMGVRFMLRNAGNSTHSVIFEGGVNDCDLSVSLGTISSGYTATLDDATFAGAFETMLKSAIARFPTAKSDIFLSTNATADLNQRMEQTAIMVLRKHVLRNGAYRIWI